MHTVFALLCFVVVIHWLIFPYPSGLLHWHCGNLTIAPVPAKQPWWIWINTSCEFIMNDCITTTKQSTTKPCAYFLGYTVRSGIKMSHRISNPSRPTLVDSLIKYYMPVDLIKCHWKINIAYMIYNGLPIAISMHEAVQHKYIVRCPTPLSNPPLNSPTLQKASFRRVIRKCTETSNNLAYVYVYTYMYVCIYV